MGWAPAGIQFPGLVTQEQGSHLLFNRRLSGDQRSGMAAPTPPPDWAGERAQATPQSARLLLQTHTGLANGESEGDPEEEGVVTQVRPTNLGAPLGLVGGLLCLSELQDEVLG